jgi:hypothetical protein
MACVVTGWAAPLTVLVSGRHHRAHHGGTQHPLIDLSNRFADVGGRELRLLREWARRCRGAAGRLRRRWMILPPAERVRRRRLRRAGDLDTGGVLAGVRQPDVQRVGENRSGQLGRCLRTVVCTAHTYPRESDSEGTDGFAVSVTQSARIASLQKSALIDAYRPDDPATRSR